MAVRSRCNLLTALLVLSTLCFADSAKKRARRKKAKASPAVPVQQPGTGHQICKVLTTCESCRHAGCGWCLTAGTCAPDEKFHCNGQSDHVGAIGVHQSCAAAATAKKQAETRVVGRVASCSDYQPSEDPHFEYANSSLARFENGKHAWVSRYQLASPSEVEWLFRRATEEVKSSCKTTASSCRFPDEHVRYMWEDSETYRNVSCRATILGNRGYTLDQLMYAMKLTPQAGGDSVAQGTEINVIHHDTNKRPNRALTVLFYLTNVSSGGETLFPCIGRDGGRPADQTTCERLGRLFSKGEKFIDANRNSEHAELYSLVDEMCSQAQQGKRGAAFAQPPRAGYALIFPQTDPLDDRELESMWHVSCPVGPGERKDTLQIFMESPPRDHALV